MNYYTSALGQSTSIAESWISRNESSHCRVFIELSCVLRNRRPAGRFPTTSTNARWVRSDRFQRLERVIRDWPANANSPGPVAVAIGASARQPLARSRDEVGFVASSGSPRAGPRQMLLLSGPPARALLICGSLHPPNIINQGRLP